MGATALPASGWYVVLVKAVSESPDNSMRILAIKILLLVVTQLANDTLLADQVGLQHLQYSL